MTLSENRLKRISVLVGDVAQVSLASVVIQPIMSNTFNVSSVVIGSIVTLLAWLLSIFLDK